MNVSEIVAAYLLEKGYDGLYGEECACELDNLFACCDGPDCDGCCAFHIVPEKPVRS